MADGASFCLISGCDIGRSTVALDDTTGICGGWGTEGGAGEAARDATVWLTDLGFSTDGRGSAAGAVVTVETGVGNAGPLCFLSGGGVVALRPKNERKPPIVLPDALLASNGCGSGCFSTMRQPGGTSSLGTSGADFTASSQAVEPLGTMDNDKGPKRLIGECFV
jgi:hypothetical protein